MSQQLRRITLAAAAALVGALIVAPAAPAHAIAGTTLVATPSDFTSAAKSVTATCPANTVVFGAGAKIVDGLGNVLISDLVPDATLTSVRAQGAENGTMNTAWQIIVYAICGTAVPNMELVEEPSLDNGTSRSPRVAIAECDAGQALYGTGFKLDGAGGEVFIDSVRPDAALTTNTVGAYEDNNYAPNWDLTAYAVCGDPVANMSLEYDTSSYDTDPTHTSDVECPSNGSTLTGIGGYLVGASGDNLMDRLQPNTGLRKATAGGRANGVVGISWGQDVYAICAGV